MAQQQFDQQKTFLAQDLANSGQKNLDDVPLPSKPKNFESVLEDNLGTRSSASFYQNDESVVSGESKATSGKREFLRRKPRQESSNTRTKVYKYYTDNFDK